MAGSGASLLRQRPLHTGRARVLLHPKILARLGLRPGLRPTQVLQCPATACTRQASAFPQTRRRRGRQLVVRAVAMVNVDFASPSLLLGTMLIGCGVLLLNLRNFQNKVSRDADIVVAAMVSIVGSTLIFQGWRLDPLLLLCQALTTSVALWYGMETFRLRSKEADLPPPQLPPGVGPDGAPLDAVQQAAAAAAAQQQQYYQNGAGFPTAGLGMPYLPPGGEQYYPWGGAADPAAAVSTSGRAPGPYGETIQYDYYGNPIMPQEPVYNSAGYTQYGAAYGTPGDAYSGGAVASGGGEDVYGTAYGAAAAPAAASAGVGYDMRGPSPGPGPSYTSPSATPAAPYATPPPPPPTQVEDRQQQPAASSSGGANGSDAATAGGYFGAAVAAGSPFGGTAGTLYDGFGAAAGGAGGSWGATPAAGPGPGAAGTSGAGSGLGGAGGRGTSGGRLDLFEKVDDWE